MKDNNIVKQKMSKMEKLNFKNSVIALAMGLVMTACIGGGSRSKSSGDESENAGEQIETQSVNESEGHTKQVQVSADPHAWMESDFKLQFDYTPLPGQPTTANYTLVRNGETLYIVTATGGSEKHELFKTENGSVVNYVFSKEKKIAMRQVSTAKTLTDVVKRGTYETVTSNPGKISEMEKQADETIAGVKCDVYLAIPKVKSDVDGLIALLGDKGKDLKKLKQQVENDNSAIYWIDKQNRFIAKKHVSLNLGAHKAESDQWVVTIFQQGNIGAGEIPDISKYTIQ
jgi:hypothetical protein